MFTKRKNKLSLFIVLIFVLSTLLSSFAVNADMSKPYKTSEIIVKFKDGVQAHEMSSFASGKGFWIKKSFQDEGIKVYGLRSGMSVDSAIKSLMRSDLVEYAQPNYIYRPMIVPNDSHFNELWGLNNTGQKIIGQAGAADVDINAPEAWDIIQGIGDIVVAVIDEGVYIDHPDLQSSIWVNTGEIPDNGIDDDGNGYIDDVNGWDFYNNDKTVFDKLDGDTHGTHVTGIIAASADDKGVLGVAPNVKIMPLKFLGSLGGSTSDAIAAIKYAKDNGAHIVNCSWGGDPGDGEDIALKEAIEASGLLFAVAAGNEGNNNDNLPVYPASFDCENIIAVAAVDNKGNKPSFSNYGAASVDVVAPGWNILSTMYSVGGTEAITVTDAVYGYDYLNGTSMAAPHVSGIAALLLSKNPDLASSQIKAAIMSTVKPLGSLNGKTVTGGIADAYGALKAIAPAKPSNLSSVKSGSSVSLTWSGIKSGDFKEYIVERKTGSGNYIELSKTSDNSYTNSSIDIYSAYGYRIKAVDNWGNISDASNEASVSAVAPPSPPSSGGSTGSSGSSGGGGGGGSSSASISTPTVSKPADSVDSDISKQLGSTSDMVDVNASSSNNVESASVSFDNLSKLAKAKRNLSIRGNNVVFEIPSGAFDTEELKSYLLSSKAYISIRAQKLIGTNGDSLTNVGGSIFEFTATAKDGSKDKNIESFGKKIKVSIKIDSIDVDKYGRNKLGVYRYDDKAQKWNYIGGTYDSLSGAIVFRTDHFSKYAVMTYSKDYDDVEGHWAKSDIDVLVSRHIAEGRSDRFEPNEYMTRAELVRMLVKVLMQMPDRSVKLSDGSSIPFKDVSVVGDELLYIDTAVKEGIIKGFDDGTFRPKNSVSRDEIASMIARIMNLKIDYDILDTSLKDKEQISAWAAKDVAAVYQKGIITGDSEGNFNGKRPVTRAEAVVTVKRMMDSMGLLDMPYVLTGKLVLSDIEGRHYELETKDGIYVLIPDDKDRSIDKMLREMVDKEVKVKGYLQSGFNIYQRGKLLKVISIEQRGSAAKTDKILHF
ncbi:MAG: S8 family serine peptidase [Lutispora sp.]|nr:S8 family serine peptidase [Lutispora sp.]